MALADESRLRSHHPALLLQLFSPQAQEPVQHRNRRGWTDFQTLVQSIGPHLSQVGHQFLNHRVSDLGIAVLHRRVLVADPFVDQLLRRSQLLQQRSVRMPIPMRCHSGTTTPIAFTSCRIDRDLLSLDRILQNHMQERTIRVDTVGTVPPARKALSQSATALRVISSSGIGPNVGSRWHWMWLS